VDIPNLVLVLFLIFDSLGSAGLKGKIRSESLHIAHEQTSEQTNSIVRIFEMNSFKIIANLQCRNDDTNNNNVDGNQSLIRTHR